ncbi:MAG: Bax inhibitor-1/YccA family protein [Elusimicrobia bacterium]|nr:Bax inhibitor-1/YccA family protein [Elusimicrobiota bacterium]
MNPVLNEKSFINAGYNEDTMTVSGVINKSFLLWLILTVGAYLGWTNPQITLKLWIPMLIGIVVLCFIIVSNLKTTPWISPIYAFLEGLFLGTVTLLFEKDYPGIAVNAVFLTICVLFCMLAAFKSGKIRATKKFYRVIGISTLAICLFYLADILLSAFGGAGLSIIHSSSPLGIAINIVIVLVAAFNLIIDFDIIQRGVAMKAPKYMEWYGAFALMVTIVWLYMEILRLLSKIRR